MAELLETYDLEWNFINLQDRKEFYKEIIQEYKDTGKISKKVKSFRMILITSSWRLYMTKRSKHKERNPWLYDKTVGWHISYGHDIDTTFIKECVEEVWMPAVVMDESKFK